MKVVFASLNALEIHHLRNLLEAEGIPCAVRNELLSRLAGEVPFTECAIELVVLRESDASEAERFVRDFRRSKPTTGMPWRCVRCGETLEPQFSACWRCGADRLT